MFFYVILPSFYFFFIFLYQNAHNTNFFTNFSQFFANFDHFWPIFFAHLFFLRVFFHLLITYHVFFLLAYSYFMIFMYFFGQNSHNTNFSQFFANFDQFRPNFVASLVFFKNFFSLANNLSCVLYSGLLLFYDFYVFFCVKIHIILIFYQFFTVFSQFLLISTNFGLVLWHCYLFYQLFFFN